MDLTGLKAEYIAGSESLAKLAQRYGVSLNALYKCSGTEGWGALRRAYRQQRLEALVDPEPLSLPAKAAVERGVAELANWLAEVIAEGRSTRCVGDAPDVKLMREMTACLRELDGLTRTDADGGTRIEVVFGENVTGCCG